LAAIFLAPFRAGAASILAWLPCFGAFARIR
jgi:hypothetical protein